MGTQWLPAQPGASTALQKLKVSKSRPGLGAQQRDLVGGGVFEVQRAQGGPETERLSGWLEHRGEGHVHSGPCRKRLHLTEDGVTKGVSRG